MPAFFVCGVATETQSQKKVPENCILVQISAKYRKIVESKLFDPANRQALESPNRAILKKLFQLEHEQDLTIVPYKGSYTNVEHNVLSFEENRLHNSGVYQVGVKKKWMEYKPAGKDQILRSELLDAFQYAILPTAIGDRMEKAFPKQSKYTYAQIQSVLQSWPFFQNVYELCANAKDAVENGDKENARQYLRSLQRNLEIVTESKNKGDEWAEPIRRFKDDLESAVKDMSKQTYKQLERTYAEMIKRENRRGGFRQSYLFRKYPGVYYVFQDEGLQELNTKEEEPNLGLQEENEEVEEDVEEDVFDEENIETQNEPNAEPATSNAPLPSITSVTMQLGAKSFILDRGIPAYKRRSDYFLRNRGSLTRDEQAVLDAIGIDKEMETRLKAYMPTFFDVLPDCQTDTSLFLSKTCEVPYFVVWSTKFAERHQTMTRIKEASKEKQTLSDYDMAIHKTFVSEMKPIVTDIDQLFIVIRTSSSHGATNSDFSVEDLFEIQKI